MAGCKNNPTKCCLSNMYMIFTCIQRDIEREREREHTVKYAKYLTTNWLRQWIFSNTYLFGLNSGGCVGVISTCI